MLLALSCMVRLYLYIVGNILVVYLWLWMSCWTYGKNNNLCLLNNFFVDSNNWKISLTNDHVRKQYITDSLCREFLERLQVFTEWLGAGRGDSNGLRGLLLQHSHERFLDLYGLDVKFTLEECCNMRSQHGK